MKNEKQIMKMMEDMKNDDGATIAHYSPVKYSDGYQVGISGIITDNIDDAAAAIELYNGDCGIWYSKGLYYIDKSVHIENRRDALTVAAACDQQSIYVWSDGSLLWI